MVLQSCSRRREVRKAYLDMRNAIIKIQAMMRGSIVHKQEKRKRVWIKKCLQEDIALLWSKERAALVYRSKFFTMIQGDSYLHLALFEDEKKRLIVSLGGLYTQSTLGAVPLSVETSPRNNGSFSHCSSPSDNPLIVNPPPIISSKKCPPIDVKKRGPNESKLLLMGVPHKLTQTVERRLSANELKVVEERKEIYYKLKGSNTDNVRDSLFKLFDFQRIMKKKKRTLSDIVWSSNDNTHMINSAQVVLSLSATASSTARGFGFMRRNSEIKIRHDDDFLDARIQSKVHQACIASVRACMISLQKQRGRELLERGGCENLEKMKFHPRKIGNT